MRELSAPLMQWMPLTAAIAFILGEAYSDLRRHRKRYQDATEELRQTLKQAAIFTDSIHRALKQQRGAINDIHRRLVAVSEGLEKHPSQTQHNQWPDLPDPAVSKPIRSGTANFTHDLLKVAKENSYHNPKLRRALQRRARHFVPVRALE